MARPLASRRHNPVEPFINDSDPPAAPSILVVCRRLLLLGVMLVLTGAQAGWALPPDGGTDRSLQGTNDGPAETEVPFDPFDNNTSADLETVADPLAGFNRAMFTFNDRLYFWLLKPVAQGYRTVIPTPVRVSVKNFFFNLMMPVRLANCLLQGKFKAAEGEAARFLVNSTIGLAGLFNPAGDFPELNPPEEDFGQTLGRYTIGNGFYLVWPLLGPSTLRDTFGAVGDWALNPFSFMTLVNVDAGALTTTTTNVAVYAVRTVNDTSFRIGDYETLKNAALDPYEAFRDAYIQNRISKIAQ